MSVLMDKIEEAVKNSTRANSGVLKNLSDKAAVDLGITLYTGALQILAAHASRQSASDIDGADAYRQKVSEIQKEMERSLCEDLNLSAADANMLVMGVLMPLNSRYQPNLQLLKQEMLEQSPARRIGPRGG